jgi:hypothetical protein
MAKLYKLIIWTGIISMAFLVVSMITAFTHSFKIHKDSGIIGFSFACIHAGLVVYRYFILKVRRKT